MADISNFNLGNGKSVNFKDAAARTALEDKTNKVSNATNGNFAGLDSNGNLTDSGNKASDFMPSDGVEANPTGTATGTLTSLGINGDKYEIPGGGGGVDTKADISSIAPEEAGSTSSRAYAVGEHFYKNGKFCTAIAAIAQGATFTLGTNYVEGTIAEAFASMKAENIMSKITWLNGYSSAGYGYMYKLDKIIFFALRINTPSYAAGNTDILRIPYKNMSYGVTFQTYGNYNGANTNKGINVMSPSGSTDITLRTGEAPAASSNFWVSGVLITE